MQQWVKTNRELNKEKRSGALLFNIICQLSDAYGGENLHLPTHLFPFSLPLFQLFPEIFDVVSARGQCIWWCTEPPAHKLTCIGRGKPPEMFPEPSLRRSYQDRKLVLKSILPGYSNFYVCLVCAKYINIYTFIQFIEKYPYLCINVYYIYVKNLSI